MLGPKLSEVCAGFDRSVVDDLKRDFPEVFSDSPGKTRVVKMSVKTGDSEPTLTGFLTGSKRESDRRF